MPRTREEAIALLQSRKNQEKPLMILCRWALHGTCSDTSFTSQAIHQLRRLADENDVQGLVLTILLPPWRFHVGKSYESALLGQWQVLHLDSLEDTEAPSLVTSILTNAPNLKPTEQLGCQEEVHKHLAAAVARLPSSDAMRRMADGWVDAERGMAQAVAFYAQAALQTRVDALWSLLTSDQLALLLDVLRRIPLAALQDISLQREAVATAKEMMGMDRCQRRPMLCLQTTVGNKCAERVVSALAAALHLICDQGGLQVLLQMGEEATFAVATDLALRAMDSQRGLCLSSMRPLQPPQETAVLPCYPHLFHMLQECLLDSRADPDSDLVTAASSAWKKHPFDKLSDCVVNSGLMRSYCQYLAQRFGFPRVAAELLELEAALYAADEQLPGLHACAWCHRSDLLALSYLFRDGVPPKVLGELKAIDGHGTNFKTNEALFGPALASSVLDLLEEKLQEAFLKATEELRKVHLNAWHHSFSAARATLGGRLLPTLSRSNRAKLHRLSFFSDLIPCMMDHGGLSILSELLAESRTMDRREMQNRCLARLATQLNRLGSGGAEVFFPTARAALQQILEDLLQPLRRESAQILELFRESVELILDIVDSRGIFASCYALVTPALGAAALQGLLEAVQQHRGKRSEMLQRFSQEFCQKVGEHPCLHLPWNAWMEWTEEHDDDTSSLPWLLYYAWRGAGTELLELDGLQPLEELRRAAGASSAPNVFTAVRRAVRQQQLLASVAESVARKTLRTAEGQQLLLHLGAQGEDSPEWMMFLNALVHYAGSTAAAGKALEDLLRRAADTADDACARLAAWATGLAKPERAAGGPGEDPWEDLPVSNMPGFEHERERRRRQDQEREREDHLYASRGECRCCPRCGKVIEKDGGCSQMQCGAHAHGTRQHGEGCGHVFDWSQAPRYQASMAMAEEKRQPPGFSAILAWVMQQEFQSPAALAAAEAALQGLSPEDRRYAFGNACACALAKKNDARPALAQALTDANNQRLRAALGLEDERLARVAAVLCDPGQLAASESLVAAVFLGRDNWEEVAGNGENRCRLKNAMLNLLVVVLGVPDNNHLTMMLLEPTAMLHSFPVGFVYGAMPGPEGYHFDCGCVLDAQGRARPASRNRQPLTNPQLHLLNFCSWTMLALGCWIFPELCNDITQVLTEGYIREVDGGRRDGVPFADSVRSFAMNYALQCFECVCRHQGLTEEDRSLVFSRLFQDFRQQAVAASPAFARTFATAEARQHYEDLWREMIDGTLQSLPELRTQAMQDSAAQSQLLKLQQFRSSLSYMQNFFHDYEKCTLALPVEDDLKFVSDLVNRREELSHLPLLEHFIRIRNWIFDRLDGALPQQYLEEPLKNLLERAMQKDEEMNHRSKKSQCQATLRSLKLFIEGWRAFYDANGGAIPIECQAGRAAMGLAAEETRLVPIGEGEEELPLSFFLSSQPQMVVKFLCTSWNELVDSAALALDQLGKSHATTWATQMKKAAPVHLADLFFQEQLVETLQSRSIQRCVLRNLLPSAGHGNVAEPRVAWTAVQLEILNSGWIHRIQKLDFPQMEEFRPARVESPASQKKMALSEEKHEEVLDKLARMQLAELQVSRDWVRWILPRLGSCEPSMKVLDHDDIQDELSGIPPATLEILDGVSIAVLPQLLQLLEEENGEFGHHLSPLLKEPAPLDLQQIFCDRWVRPSCIKAEEFQRRDAVLRETITNLEYEPFCEHATSHASTPLLEMYTMVYTPDETPLPGLPDQIRGCHLLAVLHSLRALLRDLRCRKAELDQGSVWDPQQGTVRALPLDLPLEVDKETPWWEAAPAAPDVSHAEMAGNLWNPNLDVLAFMCWACQDPLNGGDYLSQLCSDASVSKLLAACGFTAQESDRENCINRFLDSYEKQLTLSSAGHASTQRSSAAWQRSCSAELVPLPTLLAYKDVPDPEAMRQQLWHIAESKLSEDPVANARCVLPNLWRRFLDSYVAQCSSDLEEALRRVVDAANASMPRIVTVPTEAEDAAKSGGAIILKYRDEYFEVKSSAQSELAADDQWASRKAAQIQRVWRRCAKKASPPAAEVLAASSEAAEAAEAAADPPQATAVIADAVEKSDGYPAVHSAAAAVAPVIPVEVSLESVEGASEMEEVRSVQSVLTWTSQMSRLASVASVASAGDAGPSRWDRFLLDADHFLDLFPRSVPEVEGSFKQSFEAVITDGRALMKEIIIPMTQYLRKKHKKLPEGSLFQLFQSLTDDELLALVSYTYDLRKKYPKADGKLNFAAQVSVAVLNETEDPHMNVCVHHFKTAVEKCRSAEQPRTLYCAVMPNCMEHLRQLQPDEEVLWPSYTSWTTNQDVALQAATAVCGAVVQLDAPRNVSDVSVFRSERRETFSEFILPVNTPLLVKMVAEHPSGDDGDDDSRVATALILEGVDDEDVEWQHIDS